MTAPHKFSPKGTIPAPANCVHCDGSAFDPIHEVWDTAGLQEDYEVLGFQAPYVVVKRKSDGQMGSLQFTHMPRLYFGWEPHCS